MKLKLLIINYALCIVNCALLCSCRAQKPIATSTHERIETQMQAVPIGSDTIEIEYRLRCDYRPLCPTDSNSVEIAHTRHSSSELGSALVYSQFSPNSGEELNRRTALKNWPPESGGRAKRRGSVTNN